MKNVVDILSQLGERLATFGHDTASKRAIADAHAENGWFTPGDIVFAVDAIRREMLDRDKLTAWLSGYDTDGHRPSDVAIIMAGNIPLVGFFDLLCVIACSDRALIKPSNKDSVLMRHIVGLLREIEPEIPIGYYDNGRHVDAVIATGSDNANRYFKAAYAGTPSLLRGNRHSVAVLSGNESEEQLRGLGDDIFRYSGLGCRNVSLIFAPHGYELRLPEAEVCDKYRHNYLQTKALLTMTGQAFGDTGTCVTVESDLFPTALSRINISYYDSIDEVADKLAALDGELQCVVTDIERLHKRRAAFGMAQRPRLDDYPDDADVMEFLLGIQPFVEP